jgi:hypothetical protein
MADHHFTPCFIFMFVLLLFCVQIVTLLQVLSVCLYYCCFVYRSSLYSMFYLYVCTVVVLYTDRHYTKQQQYKHKDKTWSKVMICIQNNNSTNIKIKHGVKWRSVHKTTVVVLYTDRHFTPWFIFMFVLLLFCIQIVTLLHDLSLCLYCCCFVYRSSLYSMFYLYVCTITIVQT